jgi:ketopantoate hydroxymethyltransferase
MGHMGLTPQTALAHGRTINYEALNNDLKVDVDQIRRDAFALPDAGAFAIVFTLIPTRPRDATHEGVPRADAGGWRGGRQL